MCYSVVKNNAGLYNCFRISHLTVQRKELTEIKFPLGDVIMIIVKQSLFILQIGKLLPKYDLFGDRKRLRCNSLKGF